MYLDLSIRLNLLITLTAVYFYSLFIQGPVFDNNLRK